MQAVGITAVAATAASMKRVEWVTKFSILTQNCAVCNTASYCVLNDNAVGTILDFHE